MIEICIRLVTQAAVSIRGTSKVLKVLSGFFDEVIRIPVASTIRLWIMKFGLYKSARVKPTEPDWAIIIDHTIQIGKLKVLVVLGLSLRSLPANRALDFADLEPLLVLPMYKSNGPIITQILTDLKAEIGSIRLIVSDEGSDLKAGIRDFRVNNPSTLWIPDLIHRLAHMINAELSADPTWNELCKKATEARTKLLQTDAAHLLPPQRRDKARYMNLEELIKWAMRIIVALEGDLLSLAQRQLIFREFGWVIGMRAKIIEYHQLWRVLSLSREMVRKSGIHVDSAEDLLEALLTLPLGDRARRFGFQVYSFLSELSQRLKPPERMLGSSEVIESLIGSVKHRLAVQSRSGFTASCLLAGALVGSHDSALIREAQEALTQRDINSWSARHIGRTIQAGRKRFYEITPISKHTRI